MLDDVVGDESLVVVWCETVWLIAHVAASGSVAPRAGCAVRRVVLAKRAGAR